MARSLQSRMYLSMYIRTTSEKGFTTSAQELPVGRLAVDNLFALPSPHAVRVQEPIVTLRPMSSPTSQTTVDASMALQSHPTMSFSFLALTTRRLKSGIQHVWNAT